MTTESLKENFSVGSNDSENIQIEIIPANPDKNFEDELDFDHFRHATDFTLGKITSGRNLFLRKKKKRSKNR